MINKYYARYVVSGSFFSFFLYLLGSSGEDYTPITDAAILKFTTQCIMAPTSLLSHWVKPGFCQGEK